jgi:hypothetical protein
LLVKFLKRIFKGDIGLRMPEIRVEFEEWNENEEALGDKGMWNGEFGCLDDFLVVEEDININESGTPLRSRLTTHARFNVFNGVEQFVRREGCGDFNDTVQEPVLFFVSPGGGFIEGRRFEQGDAVSTGEFADSQEKIVVFIADV